MTHEPQDDFQETHDHDVSCTQGRPVDGAEDRRWLDEPANVNKIVYGLYILCALLLSVDLLDVFHLGYHKHPHFDMEKWLGFYGIYGFLGSVGLVMVAKQMRKILSKDEDYYDR